MFSSQIGSVLDAMQCVDQCCQVVSHLPQSGSRCVVREILASVEVCTLCMLSSLQYDGDAVGFAIMRLFIIT